MNEYMTGKLELCSVHGVRDTCPKELMTLENRHGSLIGGLPTDEQDTFVEIANEVSSTKCNYYKP
jgi:hypothetical protein